MIKKKSSNLTLGEAEKQKGLELVVLMNRSSLTNVLEHLLIEAHGKFSAAQIKRAKEVLKKSEMHAHKARKSLTPA